MSVRVARVVEQALGARGAAIDGHPAATDLLLNGVVAGIAALLEYAGRKDAKVSYDRTPAGARFLASWRK